jgi:hypothetical protein
MNGQRGALHSRCYASDHSRLTSLPLQRTVPVPNGPTGETMNGEDGNMAPQSYILASHNNSFATLRHYARFCSHFKLQYSHEREVEL